MEGARVLIISYEWPPRSSVAVHRPYAWAKDWKNLGCKVTVITAEKQIYDQPLDLVMPSIHGIEVFEVPYRASRAKTKSGLKKWLIATSLRFLKKNYSLVQRRLGINLDVRDDWAKPAIKVAMSLHDEQPFDIVVSTYGPRSCHLIGSALKEKCHSIVWIADYRDLWSNRHNLDLSRRQALREQSLEKLTLKKADLIVTVSAPLAIKLNKLLAKEVNIVPNGYDLDSSVLIERLSAKRRLFDSHSQFNIVYTGSIYPGWQDPSPLFEAVNQLIHEQVLKADQIRIHFFGNRQPGLKRIVSNLNAHAFVGFHGHIPRSQAILEQMNADMLLLLESGDESANGVITGKVFEYMVSGTPVISLGSKRYSALGQLIADTGIGVVCEQDVDKIKHVLCCMLDGDLSSFFSPKIDKIACYHREVLSAQYLSLIRDVLLAR